MATQGGDADCRLRQRAQEAGELGFEGRLLAEVMKSWFAKHPGGVATIFDPSLLKQRKSQKDVLHLLPKEATKFFKMGLAESKWSVVRGFHVLRHSFASNLLRAGVQRDRIADWMGLWPCSFPQRRRYRACDFMSTDRLFRS